MSDIEQFLKTCSLDCINGYTFVRELAGGHATTALLYSMDSEEIVLKLLVLPRNEDELEAFKDEAEAVSEIKEYAEFVPKIKIPYTKVDNLPIHYFGIQFLKGSTLESYIVANPLPWEWQKALVVVAKIAKALGNSLLSIVHRDLHPGNILIVEEGAMTDPDVDRADPGVRILDLGCHKNLFHACYGGWKEKDVLRPIGAVSTWSPEFCKAPERIDYKHDVWALGTLFYRFLTGSLPIEGNNFADIVSKLSAEPLEIDISKVPAPYAIQAAVRTLLAPDPAKRTHIPAVVKIANDILKNNLLAMKEDFVDLYLENNAEIYLCGRCKHFSIGSGSKCGKCGEIQNDESVVIVTDFNQVVDHRNMLCNSA